MFSMLDGKRNERLLAPMMREFNISRGDAENFMRTMVVYTHGLATLAATHGLKWSKKEAYCRMNESGIRFLQSLGISRETENALE